MSEHIEIDVAIVGGGIIGFWNTLEILKRNPSLSIAVFEKETYFGDHTTGRNSEVLHAGIYYETGSLKHLHCLEGNKRWRDFVKKYELPFLDSGKYIIATTNQKDDLEKIYEKSLENSVPGIRYANQNEVEQLSDYLNVEEALYSPTSGVLDVSSSLKKLREMIESLGGIILRKTQIEIDHFADYSFQLRSKDYTFHSRYLLNCAGLNAVGFRKNLSLSDFTDYYVKGNYLTLSSKYPAKNLIYPIPPAHGLGLGVHLTLDASGGVKFGPNTEEVTEIDYSVNVNLIDLLFPDIKKIFKTVEKDQLYLGYSGIRPKVKKNNELKKDFIVQGSSQHGIPGYIEFLGIESPGLTAAPSLAYMIATNYF